MKKTPGLEQKPYIDTHYQRQLCIKHVYTIPLYTLKQHGMGEWFYKGIVQLTRAITTQCLLRHTQPETQCCQKTK